MDKEEALVRSAAKNGADVSTIERIRRNIDEEMRINLRFLNAQCDAFFIRKETATKIGGRLMESQCVYSCPEYNHLLVYSSADGSNDNPNRLSVDANARLCASDTTNVATPASRMYFFPAVLITRLRSRHSYFNAKFFNELVEYLKAPMKNRKSLLALLAAYTHTINAISLPSPFQIPQNDTSASFPILIR